MNVLIGCECSGTVRDEFKARGHNAWSCDLSPSAKPGQHIQGDIFDHLAFVPFARPGTLWDLFIVHPPCTYLTGSAEWALGDGPYHQQVKPGTLTGAARRKARAESISFARRLLNCDVGKIALENPVGALSTAIRKPDQIIQPFEFGDDASKKTCLWLKGLPVLQRTQYVKPRLFCPECKECSSYDAAFSKHGCEHCGAEGSRLRPRWANQTDSGQNKLGPREGRGALRAVTYAGIAKAMAEQWG